MFTKTIDVDGVYKITKYKFLGVLIYKKIESRIA